MCHPVVAIAAVAASSVYSASAARAAGQAQSNQINYEAKNNQAVADWNAQATENIGEYNASVAENNALILDRAADDSIQRGADAAGEERLRGRMSNARGRAVAGSSGTVVDTGTNLDLLVQNAANTEMNALTVMNNAEREAYGIRLDANAERGRAEGIRYTSGLEAENYRIGGRVGVANAEYAGANARYAGSLNSRAALISGAANIGKMAYDFYGGSGTNDIFERNASRRGQQVYSYKIGPNPWR